MRGFRTIIDKIIMLFFILTTLSVYADKEAVQLDILSIHSYHQDYPWTSLQYSAFKKQLSKDLAGYKLNFLTEYLDTKHILPSKDYQKTFLQYINKKYKNHLPDLIYVTDDNALKFMTANNIGFTWDIPIVFSGINNKKIDKSAVKFPLMGVFEYKDIHASISLAKKLQADLSRIIFLGDGGTTDNAIKESIKNNDYEKDNLEIIHLSHSNLYTLMNLLKSIDEGIVILTTIGGLHDNQANLLHLKEIIETMTKTGRIILVMEDSYLLPGIVGGYLTTGHIQGQSAAKIASQFIRQGIIGNTKTEQQKTSELVLNWPELQYFNINLPQQLLNQARIINQPLSPDNEHQNMIKLLLFFVFLLFIVLLASIFNTRRKSRLLKEQYTDKLTGLPNRIKLLRDINSAEHPNLIIIDINNFKSINSIYGLSVGDEVLISFGQKAKNYISKDYSLYRISGCQFAIMNSNCKYPQQFDAYITTFLNNIQKNNYHIDQIDISLILTSGISRNEREFLIPMAEQALQKAKDDNKYCSICDVYEEDVDQHRKNLVWAQKLSSALSDGRIVPYFQVIVHNKTLRKDKFEALVRLIDDNGDAIPLSFFLDAAKNTRQYATLTHVMIEKTFQALKQRPITLSINLTVNDIRNEKTITFFIAKLNEYQVADRIIVEITESEGIENYHQVAEFIKVIKKMGCRVAIDDFGTGYSNFKHLIYLNVDYLKIDGSIIQNIIKDKNAEIVTKTLVEFAAQLGIETVAEYVDSKEILDKVTELGINYSQGYFLGKPESELPI